MSPQEAVQEYLKDRTDLSQSSHNNHQYRTGQFLDWCEEENITNMNTITGNNLHEYKQWRATGIKNLTLKNHLITIRQLIEFCEDIDVVATDVSQSMRMPSLDYNEDVRDTLLSPEEAEAIDDYFTKFEYGTVKHVIFQLFWHTAMRSGSLYALDVDDFKRDADNEPYLDIIHRASSGSGLKNKSRGERQIQLSEKAAEVVEAWIGVHHPTVEDDTGRLPLIGTTNGRAHRTTIQKHIYALTRPCYYTQECPHDRDIDDCEATTAQAASKCPSSVSPHALRKGSITYHRNNGWPVQNLSYRADVSPRILEKHYDKGTKSDKRKRNKEFLENL